MAKIFVVKNKVSADFTACLVTNQVMADILVFEVSNQVNAKGDFLWYYSNTESLTDSKICWVDSAATADLKVMMVKSQTQAKWTKSHRLVGRIG